MSELDERALEAAAMAIYAYQRESSPESLARMQPWSDADEMGWQAVAEQDARTAITAYLAACPTPDAEAMERVSEAEARTLIRYLLGERIELFVTPVEDERRADLERIHNERIEHIVALLTTAPAERGDETGEAMSAQREPTYIERIAQAIWWESGETDSWYPTDEASLWLGYAVLCITKREKVTAFDVHQAWSAWATVTHDGTHRSLISFEWLNKDVQAYDIPYRDAIRRVSKIVGRYDAFARDEISIKGWYALAEKHLTPSEVQP